MSSWNPPIHKVKHTTSKEFTDNIPDYLWFWIVITIEKYMMGCFDIAGHKTSWLWERRIKSLLGTGR